jgi:hypothetical protein
VLNLDFKQNDAPLLDAVYALLGQYESWLTTAPRTSTRRDTVGRRARHERR